MKLYEYPWVGQKVFQLSSASLKIYYSSRLLTLSPTGPGGPTDPGSPRGPLFPSSPMGPMGPWGPCGP